VEKEKKSTVKEIAMRGPGYRATRRVSYGGA